MIYKVVTNDVADRILLDELDSCEEADCCKIDVTTILVRCPVDRVDLVSESDVEESKEEGVPCLKRYVDEHLIIRFDKANDVNKHSNGQQIAGLSELDEASDEYEREYQCSQKP
ncbi:hypothetical protein GCM10009000_083370 [Halobacterium noricense]